MRLWPAALGLTAVVTSCSRMCSENPPAPAVDAALDVPPEAVAIKTRCTEDGPLLPIAPDDQSVEVGGGALAGTEAAIGIAVGDRAKIVLWAGGPVRTPDIGEQDPSAPPPLAIADGTNVLLAHVAQKSLVIDRITEAAGPKPFTRVPLFGGDYRPLPIITPIGSGDDLDFDVAVDKGTGLVAWTFGETILTARVPFGEGGAPTVLAKGRGDLSSPRVLAAVGTKNGGFWLAYIVTRADSDAAGVKGAAPWWDTDVAVEGPADRVWPAWVEIQSLDPDGKPIGQPTAVTPMTGRVTSFDWAPVASGLDVIARDAQATGEGASLVKAHVAGATPSAPATLTDGLGPGAPILFQENWAAFVDPSDGVHLLPLDSAKEMREVVLDGSQPVVAVPDGPKLRVVAVRVGPRGRGAELRIATCTR
jgi:hypothetical protein